MPAPVLPTNMPDAVVPDATTMLRATGLRATAPRVAVLAEIARRPHAPADEIASAARARLGAVSTAAVYEVLNTLTTSGLIRRIEPAGSPARYETRTDDNHHHIVCRRCNVVADIDCAVGLAPCLEPSNTHGFVVDEAEVTWWGLCADCAHHTSTSTSGTQTSGTKTSGTTTSDLKTSDLKRIPTARRRTP